MTSHVLRVNPEVTNEALNDLFVAAWSHHRERNFSSILQRSLAYVCAYQNGQLVGFVNLAWDGGVHAFLLDTTVHPDVRRCGVGTQLVEEAARVARARGIIWLHVDYEPHLEDFYRRCGFRATRAGLLNLGSE